MNIKRVFILVVMLFSFQSLGQNNRQRLDSIYTTMYPIEFVKTNLRLTNVMDSCYSHFYLSRAYFKQSKLKEAKKHAVLFVDKSHKLPDFEDLVAVGMARKLSLLFIKESKTKKV
jgi:hypothetical protein